MEKLQGLMYFIDKIYDKINKVGENFMRIIIAPAKKMKDEPTFMEIEGLPVYLDCSQKLLNHLKKLNLSQLQQLLKCNQEIAKATYKQYQAMDLNHAKIPALLAYDGIMYHYLAANIFEYQDFNYVQAHLRILSGFYGVLKPLDGVCPYRLELNNPFKTDFCSSLYDFWKDLIYQEVIKDETIILDLGSVQYSKIIKKYLTPKIKYVKCFFKEELEDGFKEKGVYVKMARGEMVHYLVKTKATTLEQVKSFTGLGYHFNPQLSNEVEYIFTRKQRNDEI